MQSPLLRRLSEIVVVIGADSDTKYKCTLSNDDDLSVAFQPSVLATITESKAVYPNVFPNVNFDYPPKWLSGKYKPPSYSRQTTLPSYEDTSVDAMVVNNKVNTKSRLKDAWIKTVEQSIGGGDAARTKHQSVKKKSKIGKCGFEPTVSYEAIEGLPSYCFSESIPLSRKQEKSQIVYVRLTDIKGGRLYAVGITYSRYFHEIDIIPSDIENSLKKSGYLSCIVFVICQQPYFNTCRDILSAFHRTLSDDSDFVSSVEELAAMVTNTPVLNDNAIILELEAFDCQLKIWPQCSDFDQVIDFDLVLLFQLLSVDDIIQLVVSLLLQNRMVIMSQLSTLSALCCESLLILISPFKWKFTCVPYLPQKLYDLLDAPGPFLYGCESSTIDISEYDNDIIVVDLDLRRVKYPDKSFPLPRNSALNRLKSSLNFPMFSFEQYDLSFVEEHNLKNHKDRKHFYYARITHHILTSFMDFMVFSFRDVLMHIKNQDNKAPFFNSDNFLKSQKESREFYQCFIKTELFDSFLRDRLLTKNDDWTKFEEKTRKHSLLTRMQNSSLILKQDPSSMMKKSTSLNHICLMLEDLNTSDNSNLSTFKLPSYFESSRGFIDRLIAHATNVMNNPKSSLSLKSCSLKLLIDLKQATGKKEEAIEYIYKLSQLDIRLVDTVETIKIINSLTLMEDLKCKGMPCYDAVKDLVKFDEQALPEDIPTRIQKKIAIPSSYIDIDEFLILVDNAGITSNMKVQEQLFEALSMDSRTKSQFPQVSPDNFNAFYRAWTNTGLYDIDPGIDVSEFKEDETILKLTREPIRIDPVGFGHLLLTQERLLGIVSGSLKPLIKLIDIGNISDSDYWTKGFGRYKSIKVTSKKYGESDAPLIHTLGLKQESDTWKCILNEMTCGQRVARQTKDQSYVGLAIDECFILDTIWSCQEESPYFSKYLPDIIKHLSIFTFAHQSKEYSLDAFTKKTLKQKFQPAFLSPYESVESLVCVPRAVHRKRSEFWCALTSQRSSKIIIVDSQTFELLGYVSQLQDKKAMCLLYVPLDKTVWVGCQDNTIYIVRTEDRTIVQQLSEHKDLILSFAIHGSKYIVGSGSSLGKVITWDVVERRKKLMWSVESKGGVNQMQFYEDYLFCCSKKGVFAFDENGILIKSFQYSGDTQYSNCEQPDRVSSNSSNYYNMECFSIDNDFLYIGMSRPSSLLIFSLSSCKLQESESVLAYFINEICCPRCKCSTELCCTQCDTAQKCRGISRLLVDKTSIWLACKNGNIFIYDLQQGIIVHRMIAHQNSAILSICKDLFTGYVFTGGRTPDSRIAVWDSSVVDRDVSAISTLPNVEQSYRSSASPSITLSSSSPGPPPQPPPRTRSYTKTVFYD